MQRFTQVRQAGPKDPALAVGRPLLTPQPAAPANRCGLSPVPRSPAAGSAPRLAPQFSRSAASRRGKGRLRPVSHRGAPEPRNDPSVPTLPPATTGWVAGQATGDAATQTSARGDGGGASPREGPEAGRQELETAPTLPGTLPADAELASILEEVGISEGGEQASPSPQLRLRVGDEVHASFLRTQPTLRGIQVRPPAPLHAPRPAQSTHLSTMPPLTRFRRAACASRATAVAATGDAFAAPATARCAPTQREAARHAQCWRNYALACGWRQAEARQESGRRAEVAAPANTAHAPRAAQRGAQDRAAACFRRRGGGIGVGRRSGGSRRGQSLAGCAVASTRAQAASGRSRRLPRARTRQPATVLPRVRPRTPGGARGRRGMARGSAHSRRATRLRSGVFPRRAVVFCGACLPPTARVSVCACGKQQETGPQGNISPRYSSGCG